MASSPGQRAGSTTGSQSDHGIADVSEQWQTMMRMYGLQGWMRNAVWLAGAAFFCEKSFFEFIAASMPHQSVVHGAMAMIMFSLIARSLWATSGTIRTMEAGAVDKQTALQHARTPALFQLAALVVSRFVWVALRLGRCSVLPPSGLVDTLGPTIYTVFHLTGYLLLLSAVSSWFCVSLSIGHAVKSATGLEAAFEALHDFPSVQVAAEEFERFDGQLRRASDLQSPLTIPMTCADILYVWLATLGLWTLEGPVAVIQVCCDLVMEKLPSFLLTVWCFCHMVSLNRTARRCQRKAVDAMNACRCTRTQVLLCALAVRDTPSWTIAGVSVDFSLVLKVVSPLIVAISRLTFVEILAWYRQPRPHASPAGGIPRDVYLAIVLSLGILMLLHACISRISADSADMSRAAAARRMQGSFAVQSHFVELEMGGSAAEPHSHAEAPQAGAQSTTPS
eukprot:TRINITY_DN53501_c0_g2_i1.p1 TRINITY_DN53501_c0_g2~~TRINITY_DN53501_c0_g2_i1.p1  ORF type:complete len:450 (-),score=32.12 TRINITY_DN53501_c0_g2_i1:424-1773(-)